MMAVDQKASEGLFLFFLDCANHRFGITQEIEQDL